MSSLNCSQGMGSAGVLDLIGGCWAVAISQSAARERELGSKGTEGRFVQEKRLGYTLFPRSERRLSSEWDPGLWG